jgi:RNA 3'-terminal phosphate cyclase (ATP)
MLELDGSFGEGGGQVLRSALSLSMCTGTPFRIENIRAKRSKPGLMRQHLVAVLAAKEICDAEVTGAELNSQTLQFIPGKIRAGNYQFAIGSAGSCTLVLQTILPALLQADSPSSIVLQGGTHNPMAPTFHFLEQAFLPLLKKMGADVSITLERFGFYPAGGGQITVQITPVKKLLPLTLMERGNSIRGTAHSLIAGVPANVAKRELETFGKALNWNEDRLKILQIRHEEGPGNVFQVFLEHEHVTEVFIGFGERGLAAELVAKGVVKEVREYIVSNAATSQYLGDQLLLPMALAGEGSYSTTRISQHISTNAEVIQKFLSVEIETKKINGGYCEVRIRG